MTEFHSNWKTNESVWRRTKQSLLKAKCVPELCQAGILALMVYASTAVAQESDATIGAQVSVAGESGSKLDHLNILESDPGFVPSVAVKYSTPSYPASQASRSRAGMVELEFMVNKKGRAYDVIVTKSTERDFEKSAIAAVKRYRYEPATLNGEPVDSRKSVNIRFSMRAWVNAVGGKFANVYKSTERLLNEKKSLDEIEFNLKRLRRSEFITIYALAHYYFLETRFAMRFQTKQDQLRSIQKLLLVESRLGSDVKFLDENSRSFILQNELQLLIQLGRYGEAHKKYQTLKKEMPKSAIAFEDSMNQVYEILNTGTPFASEIRLFDRGRELIQLTKGKFVIEKVNGEIKDLKLRCDTRLETLNFGDGLEYSIPKSWGECNLELIGTPETTAELIQQ